MRRQSEGLQRQIPATILNLISNGLLNSEKGLATAESAATTFLQNLGAPPLPLVPTNPVSTDIFSQGASALGGFFPADPAAVGVGFFYSLICANQASSAVTISNRAHQSSTSHDATQPAGQSLDSSEQPDKPRDTTAKGPRRRVLSVAVQCTRAGKRCAYLS